MLTTVRAALAGRYVVERELGHGSMAVVYAARELKHGRRVALKIVASDLASTVGTQRFLQEIRTTASLNHPHILPLFDSGDAAGFIYYTMPLIDGESLRRRIDQQGALPLDVAVEFVTQISSALSYAHSLGVVHRDIKPENILVGAQDHVWVADFGLARALASAVDHRLTGNAVVLGSPQYMSPEQAAGEPDADARSDVYSLGCVAFELLCGAPPFTAGSVSALLARHLSQPAPSVRGQRPDLSAEVDAALQRAMAKDRAHRFPDALDFAAALGGTRSLHREAPASPVAATGWTQMRRFLQSLFADSARPDAGDTRVEDLTVGDGPAPTQWHRPALPVAATPFVGREDELRELRELLRDSPARLITVTGPGGVGKTRLALHAAQQVATTFRDGVAYAALGGLTSPDLLVPSIAEALGIRLSRSGDPFAELQSFLHRKELLLVLDNFEQLTGAGWLLVTLLDHAAGLRILVTTRVRLRLQHETLIALDGLGVGDGAEPGDAITLFVAGARRLDRHFRIDDGNAPQITRICTVLSGIPLAIELAAACVRALSCADILAELESDLDVLSTEAPDIERRHHSMRATFDASWRLLSQTEQSVLARLAVFRSAFDRAAAADVAAADMPLLFQLVDKSLLSRTGDRLLMLEVVRAYALERLATDADAERRAYERHLMCLAGLLHAQANGVQRADAAAISRVAESIDDVRAAWNHAAQTSNVTALLRAMDGLFHFYEARGWAREGSEMFARSRTALGGFASARDAPRPVRLADARLAARHGVFLRRLGDLQAAEPLLREALAAARELDESTEIVFALHQLGAVRHGMGDYEEAERLQREAWALARTMNDRLAVAWSVSYIGNVAWSRGDFEAATRLCTDALEMMREEHDLNGMWVTLNNLGVIAASREQYEEAQRRFREVLALQSELKNPRYSAQALHNLGCGARELGDFARARQWLREALEISERMGYQSIAGLTLVSLAELAIREGDEAGAVAALHRALRMAGIAHNDPLALEALLTMARLLLWQGDRPGAAELAGIISRQPGSDRDVRRRTMELFDEIGAAPPTGEAAGDEAADLGVLIDQIVGTMPAAMAAGTATAPRRRHIRNP